MKQKPRASRKPPEPPSASPGTGSTRTRREWWFRILTMTLIPALLLAGLELVLRLVGYGYPTGFFRETQIAGRAVYVENDQFGLRFFPRAMARIPAPTVLPVAKPTNTYRIFILGESAALGDPEPAFGFGRYLEILLQERFPGARFEVVCAAMTAINSHALLPIARECANHAGDLWVIYMGNNEVVGPFGAGTILGPQSPSLFSIRASLALKATRLGQLLDATIDRLSSTPAASNSWQGMKMFVDAKTRHDDANRQRTDEHFKKNLTAILRAAKSADLPVILCTVATNLKDCAPFASLHASRLTSEQQARWEPIYRAGTELEAAGNWREAVNQYAQAAAIDGEFAELQFRLGRCQLALNQIDEARHCFERARDCDALPFRASSTLNEIIKAAGRESADQKVVLLDAEEALTQASPQKIAGAEMFYEHVHLNFEGNRQLARLVAEQAAALLPSLATNGNHRDWPTAALCDQRLGVTPWDRHRVYENVLQRETQPPFTLQLDHTNQIQKLSSELRMLRSQMNSNGIAPARALYRQALQERPDDFILHGNFAKLLEATGDPAGAVAEWERVQELLPFHFGPEFYLGKLLARLGRLDEAEQRLTASLKVRPDVAEALEELGLVLIRQKRPGEAQLQFNKALALQPGNARLHLHLAEAQAAQDQRDAAMTSLRRAIQLRPEYWEARYLLGVELAVRGRLKEARTQFSEVVRIKPDHAPSHLNLGVALAKENRVLDAILQFRETLRLDPSNQMASEYLSQLRADSPSKSR